MSDQHDYIQDIADMRSMMERSSKYMSLSGIAAVLIGIYALVGTFVAYNILGYRPGLLKSGYGIEGKPDMYLLKIIVLAMIILVVAVITAFYLSFRKAMKTEERFWNASARRVLINMAVPLAAGGIVILILIIKGFPEYMAPLSLLFYGLAFFNASKFTFNEVRSLGLIEVILGVAGTWFTDYGLWLWAIGFGVVHIIYGIYIYYRYER